MFKILKYFIPVLSIVLAAGCEKLEDTYSEWTGDGPVQYLTRVYDLQTTVKWKSVDLHWETKLDAARTHILVEWYDGTKEDAGEELIDKNATEYTVKNLNKADYSISVSAVRVGEDGKVADRSKALTVFAKPVNENSEQVTYFPVMVLKTIKLSGNRLYLSFDQWARGLKELTIEYTGTDGSKVSQKFLAQKDGLFYSNTAWPNGSTFAVLENVNYSDPVVVKRKASISLNTDDTEQDEEEDMIEIDLPEMKLNVDQVSMNPDFAATVKYQHPGITDFSYDDLKRIRELNFDTNITSLEDLLYFPNLEKVVLGGQRFWQQPLSEYPWSGLACKIDGGQMTLYNFDDPEKTGSYNVGMWRSNIVLGSSSVTGLLQDKIEVEHYGNNFFSYYGYPKWFQHSDDAPALPTDIQYWNGDGWRISGTPVGMVSLENMLDNNQGTVWKSRNDPTTSRTNILVIDMGEQKQLRGFVFVQPLTNTGNTKDNIALPNASVINIELADDTSGPWINATPNIDIRIGSVDGERSVIYVDPEDPTATRTARYIRLTISDVEHDDTQSKQKIYGVCIADFNVIKPL